MHWSQQISKIVRGIPKKNIYFMRLKVPKTGKEKNCKHHSYQ